MKIFARVLGMAMLSGSLTCTASQLGTRDDFALECQREMELVESDGIRSLRAWRLIRNSIAADLEASPVLNEIDSWVDWEDQIISIDDKTRRIFEVSSLVVVVAMATGTLVFPLESFSALEIVSAVHLGNYARYFYSVGRARDFETIHHIHHQGPNKCKVIEEFLSLKAIGKHLELKGRVDRAGVRNVTVPLRLPRALIGIYFLAFGYLTLIQDDAP